MKATNNPSRPPLLSKSDFVFALTMLLAASLGSLALPNNRSAANTRAGGSITGTVQFERAVLKPSSIEHTDRYFNSRVDSAFAKRK